MGEREKKFWDIGLSTLQSLETDRGILASGKNEIYGCVFGRDSLITALLMIHVYRKTGMPYFRKTAKKILEGLASLQGKEVNIESGEEPGKCIHEYRPDRHEHLTKRSEKPWYVYADGSMRSYDTVDATPLYLLAMYEYVAATDDKAFLKKMIPIAKRSLNWIFDYGDSNGDGFIDYRVHPERTYGGLFTHSWMDSEESLFHEDDSKAEHPIAPVEAQSYAYAALRAWSTLLPKTEAKLAARASTAADALKDLFNKRFIVERDGGEMMLAYAIDGRGVRHVSARSSMGHTLFASVRKNGIDSILHYRLVHPIAMRLMREDLFEPRAGLRTLSRLSKRFETNSYHNGSIWPHDTALVAIGLDRHGYLSEGASLRNALFTAYDFFQTPIELFVYENDAFSEYFSAHGQGACRQQAWSAAALCAILVDSGFAVAKEPLKAAKVEA